MITAEMKKAVLKCLCENYKIGKPENGFTESYPDLLEAAGGNQEHLMSIMETFAYQGFIHGTGVGSKNVINFTVTPHTHQVAIDSHYLEG